MKNGARKYESCITGCAHGFRCRRALGRDDGRRCALLCAPPGARRPRIWNDILRKGARHGHR
jgi:hypothetical protein